MHDARGRELKAGDRIIIGYVITGQSAGEDYCNVSAETVLGRKPDGGKEHYSGNAAVTLRANPGDIMFDPFKEA